MRVLASGGSRDTGAATCIRIAEAALSRGEGLQIAVCGRGRSEPQEDVARAVREMGGDAISLAGDLGDSEVSKSILSHIPDRPSS